MQKQAVILTQNDLYDGDGQQSQKTETTPVTDPLREEQIQQTKVRDYFYQDGTVLYTSDDHNQKDFNITGPSGNIITSSRIQGNDEEWYLYNKDIRGSIETVTDDEGHLAARYTYDDFGNTELMEGEEFDNEFGYTGQIYDRSSGLYYCNARYYDPEAGRFTTQDSYRGEQTEPDTYHLYAYCANDPVDYVDPSGHKRIYYFNRKQCRSLYIQFRALEYTVDAIQTVASEGRALLKYAKKCAKKGMMKMARKYRNKYLQSERTRKVLRSRISKYIAKNVILYIGNNILRSNRTRYGKYKRGLYIGGWGAVAPNIMKGKKKVSYKKIVKTRIIHYSITRFQFRYSTDGKYYNWEVPGV